MTSEVESRLAAVGAAPAEGLDGPVARAVARATQYLLAQQHARGHWQAPLEANATMEAEWVFFNRLLGREKGDLERRVGERLIALQGGDGGWPLHREGRGDLSTSLEAYAALRLLGMGAGEPVLARGRDFVRAEGGPAQARISTRVWLALLGQLPWTGVPAMPVELILLPPWAPVSLETFSRARGMVIALTLLRARRPPAHLADAAVIADLWLHPARPEDFALARSTELVTLQNLLVVLERALRALAGSPWQPLRRRAVARAIEWLLRHQDASGVWGGSLPATLLSVLALDTVGFASDHPVMVGGLHAADDFLLECEGTLMAQPAIAPTLDTALAVQALLDAGLDPSHPALARAGEWLVQAQSFRAGDWAVLQPRLEPGGWPAAPADDWYPDVRISAVTLRALRQLPVAATPAGKRALAYGDNWALGMQSHAGGYASYDVDSARPLPFPGLERALDPPSADVTGLMLGLMAAVGYGLDFGRARRAAAFLRATQRADGSWRGRWGVGGAYGIWCAVSGLVAIGEEARAPAVRGAVAWLVAHQNADGGWGEAPASSADAPVETAGSTPSQTAWGLLALLAAGEGGSEAVARGIEHLVRTQEPDGTWAEARSTGTGLPGRLPLRHHLHRHVFPLMALARHRAQVAGP